MPRYRSQQPPAQGADVALLDYLRRETQAISNAINALYDGELEGTRAFPPRDNPLLVYGDSEFDMGDGAGMYLRIGTQWYKLTMIPVGGLFPSSGVENAGGSVPTVS